MPANYRRIPGYRKILVVVASLLALLVPPSAWAETVRVGELALRYAAPWQRAEAGEEALERSVILRAEGNGGQTEVYLGQEVVAVDMDARQFLDRLEQTWARRYGDAGRIFGLDLDASAWRACRRPSRDGRATVFQLVSLHEGQAYHLLVITPGQQAGLPEKVHDLLQGIAWDGGAAEAATASARSGGEGPSATLPSRHWHLARVVRTWPQGPALARMGAEEGRRLGEHGLLTGYGLRLRESGLDWFLEGFTWIREPSGEAVRQPLLRRWQVRWDALPESWPDAKPLAVSLEFTGVRGLPTAGEFGLRLEVTALCDTPDAAQRAFDAIEKGATEVGAALEPLAATCRGDKNALPALEVWATAAELASAVPGPVTKRAEVSLPTGWAARLQGKEAPSALVLGLRFLASVAGDAHGDALLGPARVLYVYLPEH